MSTGTYIDHKGRERWPTYVVLPMAVGGFAAVTTETERPASVAHFAPPRSLQFFLLIYFTGKAWEYIQTITSKRYAVN